MCLGKQRVVCASCHGRGRADACVACEGRGDKTCGTCLGTGAVESEWFKSLRDQPPDMLSLEWKIREQKINVLLQQIGRWAIELEQDREEDRLDRLRDPSFYRGEGSQTIFVNEGKISDAEQEVNDLQDELKAIADAMRSRVAAGG